VSEAYYKRLDNVGGLMELQKLLVFIVPYIAHSLEIIGIFIIVVGTIKAMYQYIKTIKCPDKNTIKLNFAESVALALEFKIASEIIKTVIIRNINELFVLGAIILLRVILTFVLHWEIQSGSNKSGNSNKQGKSNQQSNPGNAGGSNTQGNQA
jgi:uncharacterized membrane protein